MHAKKKKCSLQQCKSRSRGRKGVPLPCQQLLREQEIIPLVCTETEGSGILLSKPAKFMITVSCEERLCLDTPPGSGAEGQRYTGDTEQCLVLFSGGGWQELMDATSSAQNSCLCRATSPCQQHGPSSSTAHSKLCPHTGTRNAVDLQGSFHINKSLPHFQSPSLFYPCRADPLRLSLALTSQVGKAQQGGTLT